jgi:hypothetical protein
MDAMNIYKKLSQPPITALREIQAGDLKGKTDINPQWRYEAMTEAFGLVGIGWKYEIQKLWTEPGARQETLAFAQVAVYVRDPDTKEWSDPIVGIGGSKLINSFSSGLKSNDEGYKMAVTDAFSTSLKMIGVAADIYAGRWDGSKYKEYPTEDKADKKSAPANKAPSKTQDKAPAPKGGADTPEQRKEINRLLSLKFSDGTPIFVQADINNVGKERMEHTADEVINFLKQSAEMRTRDFEAKNEPFPEDLPYEEAVSPEEEQGASEAFDVF